MVKFPFWFTLGGSRLAALCRMHTVCRDRTLPILHPGSVTVHRRRQRLFSNLNRPAKQDDADIQRLTTLPK
jgi:hypothetical protein